MLSKNCKQCGKNFVKKKTTSLAAWYGNERRPDGVQYCSKECSLKNTGFGAEGWIPWSKGKKGIHLSPKTEFKIGHKSWNTGLKGYKAAELNSRWKGENISYGGIHQWISKAYGKPKYCEDCKTDNVETTYQWANISGKYKRDIIDWKRLCISCHKKMDIALIPRGEAVKTSKLNSQKVKLMRMMHEQFNWSVRKVTNLFTSFYGVSKANIRYILSYHTWKLN